MEKTIYERGNNTREQLHSGIAFGRITRVFPEKRLCEVKTFMGRGSMDDNHLPGVQWLNLDSSPDGDESGVIPRVNSYGLVFYVDGEPFVLGFFSPLTGSGDASGKKEDLNEGDRVLKTLANNKIILRSHGEIQIESTRTCRTIYFPDRHLLNTLCRNYEFRTDGGTVDWLNINAQDDTLYRRELRDNIKRKNLIIEEYGAVSGELISRVSIGAGSASGIEQPVWTQTTKNTGETELFIRTPGASSGHKYTILPSGQTELNIADKTKLTIEPSGQTTLDVGPGNCILVISPSGQVTLTTKDKVNVTAKSDVSITTEGKLDATAKGKATIKANMIDIDGGDELFEPLLFDLTVDQFTGLPLEHVDGGGSKTVRISK